MQSKPIPPQPDLDALLKQAAKHVMTPAEMRVQRRSWVIGELMIEHPDLTREEAEKRVDRVLTDMGY